MNEGFIPLSRGFFDHPLWKEPREYCRGDAWLDLIQEAAFKDRKQIISGKLIDVPRGGTVASVRFLCERWKWSNTKVCQFLDMLRENDMITTEKRQGITLILLTNYERFNSDEALGQKEEKRQKNDAETTEKRRRNDETEKGNKGNTDAKASVENKARAELAEIVAYVTEKAGLPESDGQWFHDKMLSSGWKNGGQPVKDWRATIRTWKGMGNIFPSQKPAARNHTRGERGAGSGAADTSAKPALPFNAQLWARFIAEPSHANYRDQVVTPKSEADVSLSMRAEWDRFKRQCHQPQPAHT